MTDTRRRARRPPWRTLRLASGSLLALALLAPLLALASVPLVADEEANLPPATTEQEAFGLRSGGPVISVKSPPDGQSVKSPFDIDVTFGPGPSGQPVLDETLRVKYVKLFEIDITARLRPHLHDNHLLVKDADIPAGQHRIRLSIADAGGYVTTQLLRVEVR
jgi:hypothetical protein